MPWEAVPGLQWHGVAVRANGQKKIIDRLYGILKEVLNEPGTKDRPLKTGYSSIDGRPPTEFSAFIAAERQKWERIVKVSGVTVDPLDAPLHPAGQTINSCAATEAAITPGCLPAMPGKPIGDVTRANSPCVNPRS